MLAQFLRFDRNKASKEKQDELEKDYEITMTKEYNEVVDRMCNISGYYTEEYYASKAALAEKDIRLAKMMIKDGESADKIERYTGLNIDIFKKIAASLGKNLVI